ncbi:radical SAM protein [Streptomyces sp. 3MP-14]|uniref:Radical SAM protein n=2 Tax=Streptomyces TaxID=1883 RepID=A0A5N6A4Y1_9ACTN|nr:radical SAM protein [Streptomyces mimosae]KAB8179279.1 radical SAM protein [Streptomyces sp. 3MP-14]
MSLRQTVGAGLLVTLTERCPLRCAHCSLAATREGRDLDAADLLRFLRTFTPDCRPEVLMLTGGEPLTRPGLVVEAAETAREAGTRTAVLSGGFFAVGGQLPPAVRRVAAAVDHFSLSADAHHEREVPRRDLLTALETLAATGVAVSLHALAAGPDDPYPDELAADVTARLGHAVPLLVGLVRPLGRGAALPGVPAAGPPPPPSAAAPCELAAWPVVAADGAITACCQQDVVDGRRRPAQLRVGSVATDSWHGVLQRARRDPLLRMIRTVGPVHIAARAGAPPGSAPAGYCATCHRLGELPAARRWARRVGEGACGELLQEAAARALSAGDPVALVARHGSPRHAHLLDETAGGPSQPSQPSQPGQSGQSGGAS